LPEADDDIALKKAFHQRYEQFVQEHGELYVEDSIPMDDTDRRRVRNYHLFIFVFLSIFTVAFFLLLYFKFPSAMLERIYSVVMGALLIAGFAWNYSFTRKTLRGNVKTIIKGVVAGKKRGKDHNSYKCTINLSNRINRDVRVPDYEALNLGDIVQIEILGNPRFTIINPKVICLGKIPD